MADATIETKSGTKIKIEGTPEEISEVIKLYEQMQAKQIEHAKEFKKFTKKDKKGTPTVGDSIKELVDSGFFDTPKGLADIKTILEQQGRFIPMTSLSVYALEFTKRRILRRSKDNTGIWKYSKW